MVLADTTDLRVQVSMPRRAGARRVIERSTDQRHWQAVDTLVAGISFVDRSVIRGKTYYYRASEHSAIGVSPYSRPVHALAPVSVSIEDVSRIECDYGEAAVAFPVRLSSVSDVPISVTWATADSTATAADHDYVPASGTARIPAKTLSAVIFVRVVGDRVGEPTEFFLVRLTGAVHAVVDRACAVGAILNDDDDAPPVVHLDAAPLAGARLAPGTTMPIRWHAGDDVAVTSIDVLLSIDGGATFDLLATGLPNTGEYDWVVTPAGPGDRGTSAAVVAVHAHDGAGNVGEDVTAAPFTILPPYDPFAGLAAPLEVDPDPSITELRVTYRLAQAADARLEVLDLQGREVALVDSGWRSAGVHHAIWGMTPRPQAGVYFLRCRAGRVEHVRRFVVAR